MEMQRLESTTYIAIHERTPDMRILYVTSGIRQGLLYEPEEFVGRPVQQFIVDDKDAEEITKHLGSYSDENIMIASIFGNSKYNVPVFLRSIAFGCGNICFHMVTTYPNITIDALKESMSVQKYKWVSTENSSSLRLSSETRSRGSSASHETDDAERSSVYKRIAHAVGKTYQACIVLDDLEFSNADGSSSARILFVTNSISSIINAESYDLQKLPFLSLVSVEDIAKAALFLAKVKNENLLAIEKLRLLKNPLEENLKGWPVCVTVEFMARGSDAGAIMICQPACSSNSEGNVSHEGYMSLEEIISSDIESSDFALI